MSETIEQTADKVVPLHKNLDKDWSIIAEEKLDILFYLDIGMDPYTYFLSFARLASLQAVTIGHAEASGVPNIDYFLSSKLTEPADASTHYTEQLIKLKNLSTYYYRPEAPKKAYFRNDFGLSEGPRLYLYPQLHPGLDATLGELLRRDLDGLLVLIDDAKGGHLNNLLIERFGRSLPDVTDRVTFIPKIPYEKFLGLQLFADVVLDNPFFSKTNSGLEAFDVNAAIVALPGEYCSGNCVTA